MADEYLFYRCVFCGKIIPPRRLKKASKGGKMCKCGSVRIKPTNVSLCREIIYLIFHPSAIKMTILNPYNWGKWGDHNGTD